MMVGGCQQSNENGVSSFYYTCILYNLEMENFTGATLCVVKCIVGHYVFAIYVIGGGTSPEHKSLIQR